MEAQQPKMVDRYKICPICNGFTICYCPHCKDARVVPIEQLEYKPETCEDHKEFDPDLGAY